MPARKHSVISLFSGALGLDLGLEAAGFEVRVAIECNKFAAQTIKQNRPKLPLIERKLEEIPTVEILKFAKLTPGKVTLVTGGPSCQPFSTAGRRGSVDDPRGVMFHEFLRVVKEARPKFFIMENVKGVMSAAVKHRPLMDRGPGTPALKADEELGSAFKLILKALHDTGYHIIFGLVNAADYGVPQTRQRLVFIGSRDGHSISLPKPTHDRDGSRGLPTWTTLADAFKGLRDRSPQYHELTPRNKKYLKRVPEGGNWRDLPKSMQEKALGGAYKSWGGRCGFFRRLATNKPAPSLTTAPDGRATMVCHPTLLRPLSVREYARLQQFPDQWKFVGGIPQKYIQIGNAVPLGLGCALGRMLKKVGRRVADRTKLGIINCSDSSLLDRFVRRPRTIMNPQRMRKVKGVEAARKWLGNKKDSRRDVLKHVQWDAKQSTKTAKRSSISKPFRSKAA
jgi:DNA (cytosine-5)-methyltransferase 1